MENLNIEILTPRNGFKPAKLLSLKKDSVLVSYPTQQTSCTVPLNQVRLAPTSVLPPDFPQSNALVDVFLPPLSSDSSPRHNGDHDGASEGNEEWFQARIQTVKGDLILVELEVGSTRQVELVERDAVRPRCQHQTGHLNLESFEIHFPPDLKEYASDLTTHSILQKFCDPCILQFNKDTQTLIIMSPEKESLRRAALLEEMHLKSLKQRALVDNRAGGNHDVQPRGEFVEDFQVASHLMGLAMGKRHENLQTAMRLDDVVDIDVRQDTIIVYAKTKEAALKARSMLEFVEDRIPVPVDIVARIIGKMGSVIQGIVDKTGVVRVVIEEPSPPGDEEPPVFRSTVPFLFVGTTESVTNAKLLVEFYIDSFKDLGKFEAENLELIRELRSVERATRGGRGQGDSRLHRGNRDSNRGGASRTLTWAEERERENRSDNSRSMESDTSQKHEPNNSRGGSNRRGGHRGSNRGGASRTLTWAEERERESRRDNSRSMESDTSQKHEPNNSRGGSNRRVTSNRGRDRGGKSRGSYSQQREGGHRQQEEEDNNEYNRWQREGGHRQQEKEEDNEYNRWQYDEEDFWYDDEPVNFRHQNGDDYWSGGDTRRGKRDRRGKVRGGGRGRGDQSGDGEANVGQRRRTSASSSDEEHYTDVSDSEHKGDHTKSVPSSNNKPSTSSQNSKPSQRNSKSSGRPTTLDVSKPADAGPSKTGNKPTNTPPTKPSLVALNNNPNGANSTSSTASSSKVPTPSNVTSKNSAPSNPPQSKNSAPSNSAQSKTSVTSNPSQTKSSTPPNPPQQSKTSAPSNAQPPKTSTASNSQPPKSSTTSNSAQPKPPNSAASNSSKSDPANGQKSAPVTSTKK